MSLASEHYVDFDPEYTFTSAASLASITISKTTTYIYTYGTIGQGGTNPRM